MHSHVDCNQSITLGTIQLGLGLAILALSFITKQRRALYVGILFMLAPFLSIETAKLANAPMLNALSDYRFPNRTLSERLKG